MSDYLSFFRPPTLAWAAQRSFEVKYERRTFRPAAARCEEPLNRVIHNGVVRGSLAVLLDLSAMVPEERARRRSLRENAGHGPARREVRKAA